MFEHWWMVLRAPEGDPSPAPDPAPDPGPDPSPDPDPNPAPAPDPVDWRAAITDDKLRASADKYASLDELVKSHNQLGGELKTRIKPLGEDPTAEDLAKYRKAMGAPESEDGYVFEFDEDADDADKQIADMFRGLFHKHNLPAAMYAEAMEGMEELNDTFRATYQKRLEDAQDEAESVLEKEWGADFDANLSLGARAAKTHGGEDFLAFLDNTVIEGGGKLGDHPAINKFLATIGRKTDEAEMVLQSNSEEREKCAGGNQPPNGGSASGLTCLQQPRSPKQTQRALPEGRRRSEPHRGRCRPGRLTPVYLPDQGKALRFVCGAFLFSGWGILSSDPRGVP